VLLVVLVLLGLLLGTAATWTRRGEPTAARTRAALAADVARSAATDDALLRRVTAARAQIERLRTQALANSSAGDRVRRELATVEAAVGATAVSGPGLVVELGDAAAPDPVTGEPRAPDGQAGTVLDRDLQHLVNALWAAGASALAVDGRRLSPTTAIRSAGGAVLVDFRPVDSPYTVAALGEPNRLRERLEDEPGFRRLRALASRYGLALDLREEQVRLPAAAPVTLRAAKPLPAGGS